MEQRVIARAGFAAFVAASLVASGTARAQEAVGLEDGAPSSVKESKTSTEGTFTEPKERVRLTELLKDYLKDKPPFLRDSTLKVNARSYFLRRDKLDATTSQAWAGGGSIGFKSGYLWDALGIGVTGYTSLPLYGPDDEGGSLLLESDDEQSGYGVVGELYAEVKLSEEMVIDLYRRELNTPFINRNDNRMTPNTFEGYTLVGSHEWEASESELRYGAGWVSKIKERNSDRFVSMSEDAGSSTDRGVVVAGFNYKTKNATFGLSEYFCKDVLNIVYTEARYSRTLEGGLGLLGAVQLTDQRGTGDDLLGSDESFSTNQFGVKFEASFGGALLALAHTTTSSGASMTNPWSSYPGYTSVQVDDFNRADEDASLVKFTYDFTQLGLKGLSATVLWVHGRDVDQDLGQDEDEYDIDLQWRPETKTFKGLWFRARRAYIRQRGVDNDTLDDYRLTLNYDFAVF